MPHESIAEKIFTDIKDEEIYSLKETQELCIYRDGAFLRGVIADSKINELIQQTFNEKEPGGVLSTAVRNNIKKQLRDNKMLSEFDFDENESRLILENGFYDKPIQDGFAEHFTENHYKTFYKLPVEYDPAAECPNIDKFLEAMFGADRIDLIHKIIAYLIFPTIKYQKAFIFFGEPNTGKTTFITMLEEFIGINNWSSIPLQYFQGKFQLANLRDKQANFYDDLSFGKIKDISTFKQAVTNRYLSGEVKHIQGSSTWRNRCKLLFTCNELPEVAAATGDDFWRRIILVHCTNIIEREDKNLEILNKIISPAEFSGLLNKVLVAWDRLEEQKSFPEVWDDIEYVEAIWQINTNPLALFIKECCEFDKKEKTPVNEFRAELNTFREKYNGAAVSQNLITRKLKELKILRSRKKSGDVYAGIKIIKSNIEKKEGFLWEKL